MTLSGSSRRRWRLGLVATAAGTAVAFGTPAWAAPAEGTILNAGGATAVADSYIVVLKDDVATAATISDQANRLVTRHGGTVQRTYRHALRGFETRMSAAQARRLAADPTVKYVEQNHTVTITGTQSPTPSWGLDRIDQRALPLDNSYTYPNTGSGVRAYIIDSGIRYTHNEFGGRAVAGFDAYGEDGRDCSGHGTHVAGIVGGATFGVAKDVTLVSVRVLNCSGSGTIARILAGIDWVTGDHDPGEPAVANMSLGSGTSRAMSDALTVSIADGVTYVVSAGNDNYDACKQSPANVPGVITVGATTDTDTRAEYSNHGTCLDIFAPGSSITSAWDDDDDVTRTLSGTSMAAPHVTGAAALLLASNPGYTPEQVGDRLLGDATNGVVTDAGPGSPNKLLHIGDMDPPDQFFTVSVDPTDDRLAQGASVTATVRTTTTFGAPQPVTLHATGLPAGVTASFSPSTLTSGESATLTLSAAETAIPAGYTLTIVGTGSTTWHSTSFELTVTNPPGCLQTNETDMFAELYAVVESPVFVSGCPGTASARSRVAVRIVDDYTIDLVIILVAPDGTTYPLQVLDDSRLAPNIDKVYTVDLSSETSNGTWRLRMIETLSSRATYIDSWTLILDDNPPSDCIAHNDTDISIPTGRKVESAITLTHCPGNGYVASEVQVRIVHPRIEDLMVSLVAPDGTVYVLHRAETSTNDIDQTYLVNLSDHARSGVWKLRVRDIRLESSGHLDGWSLRL